MVIYCVKNKINGKIYIGQTSQTLKKRKQHHLRSAELGRYDTYFHKALKKYGPAAFKWVILEHCDNRGELNEREKYYISKFDSFVNGYNMSLGGLGHSNISGENHPMFGKHHSEETKRKLRKINLGKKLSEKTKEKIGRASKLRKLSYESRMKISAAHKGKKLSEQHIKHISESKTGRNHPFYGKKLTKEHIKNATDAQSGRWLITFPDGSRKHILNLNKFCRENGLSATSMHRVADGISSFHKGFKCQRIYNLFIKKTE